MTPAATGTIVAGLIMDNLQPELIWYLCGIGTLISAIGCFALLPYVPRKAADAVHAVGD